MKQITAIMIGAGQRGNTYSAYALDHSEELRIVGVAEPDETRRNEYKEKYNLPDDKCLYTWEDVFKEDKWADAVMICTQDAMHFGPAMAAIEKGYDILLEKPIAPTAEECRKIADAATKKGVKILVCHTMRYTPLFNAIKDVIDSGEIGDIMTVVHNENVGDYHQAHSFVRGNWSNLKESSPMILAKSCHDLDMLQWILSKKCIRLSSFGTLSYFRKEYCPENAPPRCTDGCTVDCVYDARKFYLGSENMWFRPVAAGCADPTDEQVEEALKTGPYGRCVYQCDNDVVDHQVVSMEFEDSVTVIFSMTAFTPEISRSIKIMGTKGQMKVHTVPHTIEITKFKAYPQTEERTITIQDAAGHSGGDTGIIKTFCAYVRGDRDVTNISEVNISADNHMLCFAAEHSRVNSGTVVEMDRFA